MPIKYFLLIVVILIPLMSGCGVLFGNIKPVDEKSENYIIEEPSIHDSDWIRIDEDVKNNEQATDLVFQSLKTSSIISLNSACRPRNENESRDLKVFTNMLLMGIGNIKYRSEKNFQIKETQALETTTEGQLNGESMTLRTVVLRNRNCIYDLMYVARPEHFKLQEPIFSKFVGSLELH